MTGPAAELPLAHTLVGDGPPVLLLHGLGGDRNQTLAVRTQARTDSKRNAPFPNT